MIDIQQPKRSQQIQMNATNSTTFKRQQQIHTANSSNIYTLYKTNQSAQMKFELNSFITNA